MRIGIHTSTAGSLERAALKAHELGANCFQIFSASPRMWRAGVPDPLQVKLLRRARERYDLTPLAVHAGYLINLASLDPLIRGKSIEAFRGELDRAGMIGAEYLVVHPGNAKGQSMEEAIAAFVLGLKDGRGIRARPGGHGAAREHRGRGRADRREARGVRARSATWPANWSNNPSAIVSTRATCLPPASRSAAARR